jgi:hypothetical protein
LRAVSVTNAGDAFLARGATIRAVPVVGFLTSLSSGFNERYAPAVAAGIVTSFNRPE